MTTKKMYIILLVPSTIFSMESEKRKPLTFGDIFNFSSSVNFEQSTMKKISTISTDQSLSDIEVNEKLAYYYHELIAHYETTKKTNIPHSYEHYLDWLYKYETHQKAAEELREIEKQAIIRENKRQDLQTQIDNLYQDETLSKAQRYSKTHSLLEQIYELTDFSSDRYDLLEEIKQTQNAQQRAEIKDRIERFQKEKNIPALCKAYQELIPLYEDPKDSKRIYYESVLEDLQKKLNQKYSIERISFEIEKAQEAEYTSEFKKYDTLASLVIKRSALYATQLSHYATQYANDINTARSLRARQIMLTSDEKIKNSLLTQIAHLSKKSA